MNPVDDTASAPSRFERLGGLWQVVASCRWQPWRLVTPRAASGFIAAGAAGEEAWSVCVALAELVAGGGPTDASLSLSSRRSKQRAPTPSRRHGLEHEPTPAEDRGVPASFFHLFQLFFSIFFLKTLNPKP
jgi:hypothetical protein